jgi:hypothetical protein
MAEQHGLLVKDAQGNVYFLRQEILDKVKVSQEEIRTAPPEFKKHIDALRGGDVAGYALQSSIEAISGYKIRVAQPSVNIANLAKVAADTTMCPW